MYLVEEAFAFLLVLAVLLTLILLTATAFLLLWQAARFVFLPLKGMLGQVTSIYQRPFQAEHEPFIPRLER